MVGIWKGSYKYKNQSVQEIMGYAQTYFTIKIEKFDGVNFEGIVEDDVDSGGMKDAGKIIGRIIKGRIVFEKHIPKKRLLVSAIEIRTIPEEKHPVLYYSGNWNTSDKNQISGQWKFKKQLAFFYGFLPYFFNPGQGTFEMKRS